jgi:aspartate/methionine/tyrosine aminotransferase
MFAQRTGWKLAQNRHSLAIEKARNSGVRLLDLTASNPTRCNFNFDSATILNSLCYPESLDYDPQPQGLLSARQSVAAYYAELPFAHQQIAPEQIFLTTSTSEAYSFLFRLLCDPGDEVLVPRPSYPLFDLLADIQDVQLRPYDLFYDHGWHIDVAGLTNAAGSRTRAIMVVNPNNPTGSFVHGNELRQIASLCRERQMAVISDEVFLDYAVEKQVELSVAFERECLSFALSGLSKISCLPQMKLAWIVVNGPEELRQAAMNRLEIIADTYLSVNAPIQHALPTLLGQREHLQRQLSARVRQNLRTLDQLLAANSALQRLIIEGGWYAVLRIPVTKSDEEVAIELIERAGVVVHPGHFYNFPQDGFIVVSLITPEAEFEEGIARLVEGF